MTDEPPTNAAELIELARAHIDAAIREVETAVGRRLYGRPTVLDASFVDAVAMWRQTTAYDAAMRKLMGWWPHANEQRPLGSLLKIIPADVADEVVGLLRRAGFPDLPDVDGG